MNISIDSKSKAKFKEIKFSNLSRTLRGHFPDFLIIGPQRTGTTWLARQLELHPAISMSFPKELYFFNRLRSKHSMHYERFSWLDIIKRPQTGIEQLIKIFYFDLLRTGTYSSNQLEWYLRFFQNDLLHYIVHRNSARHKLSFDRLIIGEATASYTVLSKSIISEIKMINPNLKAVMMVRNPIERSWSHAKKDLVRNPGKQLEEVSKEEFIRFFKKPYQIAANSYKLNIETWSEAIGRENLFVGHFDDVAKRPASLLVKVFNFLNVPAPQEMTQFKLQEKLNPTDSSKVPEEFKEFLYDLYKEEIEYLPYLNYN